MKFREYLDLHYQLFRVMVLQLGLHCPLRCRHCSVFAAPGRPESLPADRAGALVDEFAALATARVVVLTGGEPFSDLPKLRHVLERVACHPGLHGYAITSAHWAVSPEAAAATLAQLPPLSLLMVSADEYHEEFVPRERLRYAIAAALDLGTDVVLSIAHHGEADGYASDLQQWLGRALLDRIEVDIVRVMPTGRAKAAGIGGFDTIPSPLPEGACDIVGTPVVVASGSVIACCQIDAANDAVRGKGSPYLLGHAGVDSLARIRDRFEGDDLMHALRVWGPAELARLLDERGLKPALQPSYDGICFLCRDLLSDAAAVDALRAILKQPELRRQIWMSRMLQYGEVRPCPVEVMP